MYVPSHIEEGLHALFPLPNPFAGDCGCAHQEKSVIHLRRKAFACKQKQHYLVAALHWRKFMPKFEWKMFIPIIVFPVPGGPNNSRPLSGFNNPVNKSGHFSGVTTASYERRQ